MPINQRRYRWLVAFVKRESGRLSAELRKEKSEGSSRYEKSDWLWDALVGEMATHGGVKFADKLTEADRKSLKWRALKKLSNFGRRQRLRTVMNKTRRLVGRDVKGNRLATDFEILVNYGGPSNFKKTLERLPDARTIIAVMETFDGFGPKMARNAFMGAYHPKFRDTAAVDSRLIAIGNWLDQGFSKWSYVEKEALFQDMAKKSGLRVWDVDRILFKAYAAKNGELKTMMRQR